MDEIIKSANQVFLSVMGVAVWVGIFYGIFHISIEINPWFWLLVIPWAYITTIALVKVSGMLPTGIEDSSKHSNKSEGVKR